jgi:hypothetical protein
MIEVEASLGIRLNALSAFLDDDGDLKVFGEAHFTKAPTEDSSASVNVVVYDTDGRIVGKNSTYIGSAGMVFDAFDVCVYGLARPAAKVRVFLKKE